MADQERSPAKWIATIAVFTAASAAGGLVKFPSPVGSIAFDSAPGYFVAAYVSPVMGGVVGALGHIASAATAGFPLGFVHGAIAAEMFIWCLVFGLMSRVINRQWALIPAGFVAVVLNGVVGPLMLGVIGIVPMTLAYGVMAILSLASAANVLIASIAITVIANRNRSARTTR